MCRFYFFLALLFTQLPVVLEAMSLHDGVFKEDQAISSQPGKVAVHPGLAPYKAGAEELKKFQIIIKEDGTSESCKPLQIFKALNGGISDDSALKFFRQSNELGYKPSRGILLMLLTHASGIYMEKSRAECSPIGGLITMLFPILYAPPQLIIPTSSGGGGLPYGTHVCGIQKALKIHYRLLMERRDILDQYISDDISDVLKNKKREEKMKVQYELQKTANFMGRSSWGGFCCSMLICVGLPLSCCEDTGSSICGKWCGPKDHLTSKNSLAEYEKNSLKELLLKEQG